MKTVDILGEVILNVFRFAESGFDKSLILEDKVNSESITAGEMFSKRIRRWFIRTSSLPGDPSICAVAVDEKSILLEASPIDEEEFKRFVRETRSPFKIGTGSITDHDDNVVIKMSEPKVIPVGKEGDLSPRCLYEIPYKNMGKMLRWEAVTILDQMYSNGVFSRVATPGESVQPIGQELRMDLSMSLICALELVQRPILSLQMQGGMFSAENMEMRALMAMQFSILKMSREELLDFTAKYVAKHGEARTFNLFLFIIAGKVKKVRPTLSWKQAREIARNLVTKK